MLVLCVAVQAVGCVLLAIALWRRRAGPRWAAAAVGFPIIGLAVFPAGAALAVAGFAARVWSMPMRRSERIAHESPVSICVLVMGVPGRTFSTREQGRGRRTCQNP